MPEYSRTFPASHKGWICAEIDRLIASIPDQPAFASDPLRKGDVMLYVRVVEPPSSLLSPEANRDQDIQVPAANR